MQIQFWQKYIFHENTIMIYTRTCTYACTCTYITHYIRRLSDSFFVQGRGRFWVCRRREVQGILSVISLCKFKTFEFSRRVGASDDPPPLRSLPFLDPRMVLILLWLFLHYPLFVWKDSMFDSLSIKCIGDMNPTRRVLK